MEDYTEALKQLDLSKKDIENAMYHLRQTPSVSKFAVISYTMLEHVLKEILIEIERVREAEIIENKVLTTKIL